MNAKILAGKLGLDGKQGKTLWPSVRVRAMIIMTEECNLQIEDERKDKVQHLEGVEKEFLKDRTSTIKSCLTEEHRRLMVERLIGKLDHYKVLSSSPTFPSNLPNSKPILILQIRNGNSFSRTYYSEEFKSLLIGKNQLRGATPGVWADWDDQGMVVTFLDGTLGLEITPGTGPTQINGRHLTAGQKLRLDKPTGTINLAGVGLQYVIRSIDQV